MGTFTAMGETGRLRAEVERLTAENDRLKKDIGKLENKLDSMEEDDEERTSFDALSDVVHDLRNETQREAGSFDIRLPHTERTARLLKSLFEAAGVQP